MRASTSARTSLAEAHRRRLRRAAPSGCRASRARLRRLAAGTASWRSRRGRPRAFNVAQTRDGAFGLLVDRAFEAAERPVGFPGQQRRLAGALARFEQLVERELQQRQKVGTVRIFQQPLVELLAARRVRFVVRFAAVGRARARSRRVRRRPAAPDRRTRPPPSAPRAAARSASARRGRRAKSRPSRRGPSCASFSISAMKVARCASRRCRPRTDRRADRPAAGGRRAPRGGNPSRCAHLAPDRVERAEDRA